MDYSDFKETRKKLNLNQEKMAELLGVSASAVRSWEQDQRPVPNTISILIGYILADESPEETIIQSQQKTIAELTAIIKNLTSS